MSSIKWIVCTGLVVLFSSAAQADCEGDGCQYLRIEQEQDCIVLENSHVERDLDVSLEAYVWEVPANGSVSALIEGGECLSRWTDETFHVQLEQEESAHE